MMKIGTWLLGMMGGMTAKVLLALGFSVVTVVGMDQVFSQLRTMFLGFASQVPAAGLNLALLGGVGEGFGIIFGAILTRLALWKIQAATKILGRPS